MTTKATVIADSVNPRGIRLTTFEIEFPRFIIAEINTYRNGVARNYQSSRAVSLSKQRKLVMSDPFIPARFTKNGKGMSNSEFLTDDENIVADMIWRGALQNALRTHQKLESIGVHKQYANRLLEPFMYTRGIITTDQFALEHIFAQRISEHAQPEFRTLAIAMRDAYNSSVPNQLKDEEYHVPYFDDDLIDNMMRSVVACAQVSYRNQDFNMDTVNRVYDQLISAPHLSPFEHLCQANHSREKGNGTFIGFDTWRGHIEGRKL